MPRIAAVVVSTLTVLAPASTAGASIVEVRRISLEVPYVWRPELNPQTVMSPDGSAVYALSRSGFFVVDARTGRVAGVVDLDAIAPGTSGAWTATLAGRPGAERLVVWTTSSRSFGILALDEPLSPTLVATGLLPKWTTRVEAVPGRDALLALSVYQVEVLDVVAGGHLGWVPEPPSGWWYRADMAVGGPPDAPRLVTTLYQERSSGTTYAMAAYDLAEPEAPALSSVTALPPPGRGLVAVSGDGTLAVLVHTVGSWPDSRGRYEVWSLTTGLPVSAVEPAGGGFEAALCEGDGARALAVADENGVDLVDLAVPETPRVVGRVEVPVLPRGSERLFRPLLPSRAEPLLLVAATMGRAVLAVDVRDAGIVGSWSPELARPVELAMAEDGGRRTLAVVGARVLGTEVLQPDGISHIDVLDATDPGRLRESSRFVRTGPLAIEGFGAVAGAYAAVSDRAANSIALVRMSDGAVVDTQGFRAYLGGSQSGVESQFSAGSSVLVTTTDAYEVFDVVGGGLVRRASVVLDRAVDGFVRTGAVMPDGTAVVLTTTGVRTLLRDGRTGFLPADLFANRIRVSPGGTLLLLEGSQFGAAFAAPEYPSVVDVTDATRPRLLWSGYPLGPVGVFLDDERVLETYPAFGWAVTTRIIDARTGAALGEESAPVEKWFYHDTGIAFGSGAGSRAVFWRWTFAGWHTLLYDTSGATPVLVRELPEYFDSPLYLPRGDDGWYELFGGDILVGDASGAQRIEGSGPRAAEHADLLRRGFVATATFGYQARRELFLWRDTALNRPPVADAAADRAVECSGREATRCALDGSGSHDPDSAPGTQDDIARYAWSVDGAPAAEGVTADVDLALGAHAVALRVEDALGLSAEDAARVEVRDTLAPDVRLDLAPDDAGGVITGRWRVSAEASDRCDGSLAARRSLVLPDGAALAPVSFAPGAATTIEIRSGKTGTRVVLTGPDETLARATWRALAEAGSIPIESATVALRLAEATPGRDADLVARYVVGSGGALDAATAYGDGADLVTEASAEDLGGRRGAVRASLRATIADLCAMLPAGARCVP